MTILLLFRCRICVCQQIPLESDNGLKSRHGGSFAESFYDKFTKSELTNHAHQISDFKAKMHQNRLRLGLRDPTGGSNGTYREPTDDLNSLSDRGGHLSCLKPI